MGQVQKTSLSPNGGDDSFIEKWEILKTLEGMVTLPYQTEKLQGQDIYLMGTVLKTVVTYCRAYNGEFIRVYEHNVRKRGEDLELAVKVR